MVAEQRRPKQPQSTWRPRAMRDGDRGGEGGRGARRRPAAPGTIGRRGDEQRARRRQLGDGQEQRERGRRAPRGTPKPRSVRRASSPIGELGGAGDGEDRGQREPGDERGGRPSRELRARPTHQMQRRAARAASVGELDLRRGGPVGAGSGATPRGSPRPRWSARRRRWGRRGGGSGPGGPGRRSRRRRARTAPSWPGCPRRTHTPWRRCWHAGRFSAGTGAAAMEYRILGPLEIADGDRAVQITARKQRALLALPAAPRERAGLDRPHRRGPLGGAAAGDGRKARARLRLPAPQLARERRARDGARRLPGRGRAGRARRGPVRAPAGGGQGGARGGEHAGRLGAPPPGARALARAGARGRRLRGLRVGRDRTAGGAPPGLPGGAARGATSRSADMRRCSPS